MHRTMSWNVPRTVALLMLCVALVAPQTFQYSRGWTNGRKRGGMMLMGRQQPLVQASTTGQTAAINPLRAAAAAALLDDAALMYPGPISPCQRGTAINSAALSSTDNVQRYRAILDARSPQQNAQEWKDDASVERRRRGAKFNEAPNLELSRTVDN